MPLHTSTGVCVCIHLRVCVSAFLCVFARVCTCVTYAISMEIKHCSSHKFTHSPSFDSIQSTVCIITLVLYGNLLGPKYCGLTNPSFVFSRYTKHQSFFSTHGTHQTPSFLPSRVCSHTYTYITSHTPTNSPTTQSSVKLKAGWLEQQDMLRSGFVINISLFQMVPPIKLKDITNGQQTGRGLVLEERTKWWKTQSWITNSFSLTMGG